MLQGQFMFAHLGQNGANVQVDVAWIGNLEAIVDGMLAEVQIVVLDFQCLF